MVIAALISFGILLVAWITAPGGEPRARAAQPAPEQELFLAEGVARAA